ncbi:hypothetical protein FA15DRAFT_567340, partial [Coprinopsis marcescibilis]
QISDSGPQPIIQECVETTPLQPMLEHTNAQIYILNMHALHNACLVRRVLPQELTQPI